CFVVGRFDRTFALRFGRHGSRSSIGAHHGGCQASKHSA
ncbi:MAG: hypothetical protein AVDCRST_MAG73-1897, partial [uncultured Thermomicrobiales bacterium]